MPLRATPTPRLLIGFAVTLAAVVLYSLFTLRQVASLRALQSQTVDRNRLVSVQLLRIQSSLNSLGLAIQDISSGDEPYPIAGFEQQFQRIRADIEDAASREAALTSKGMNTSAQTLGAMLATLRATTDSVFRLSREGKEKEALAVVRSELRGQQSAMTAKVARMLIQNYEADQQAAITIQRIYDRVERDIYTFLLAVVLAIMATATALMIFNRRLFDRLAELSAQKSTLARKLISVQEEVLRSVSRELHDEFGQIFTAIGAMLSRLERKEAGADSQLRKGLNEIREITQSALDQTRSLSQMLHPAILDDYGLERAVEWYVPMFEKQTGIGVKYEKSGTEPRIQEETAIHIYRILQEALNNVAKHSGSKQASVRVHYAPEKLRLEIEDHGRGIGARSLDPMHRGLGLVAMRERAELVHGNLNLHTPAMGGTLVTLEVPIAST